ncbi:hypothetical protein Tco_0540286 [Tanacetum coccineum]
MSQPANVDFSQHLSDDEASYHEDASENGIVTNKPKQQQQLIPTTTTISNIKLPILKKDEYDIWAIEMEHYLEYIDNDVWKNAIWLYWKRGDDEEVLTYDEFSDLEEEICLEECWWGKKEEKESSEDAWSNYLPNDENRAGINNDNDAIQANQEWFDEQEPMEDDC